MESPWIDQQQRLTSDWLIGEGSDRLVDWVESYRQELQPLTQAGVYPKIMLMAAEPVQFLAGFIAASIAECPVFLGNPSWAEADWQLVCDRIQPDRIWGRTFNRAEQPNGSRVNDGIDDSFRGQIMIPTGGSSGQIRFAVHTWSTLMASVRGFQHYFQVTQIHSCCVLPLYHVSGLMQFLRSFTSGGTLAIVPSKQLQAGILPAIDPADFFLSLVPTQLHRLLQQPTMAQWLSRFQTVLLGGAPAWDELFDQARQYQIHLAPTYGTTETASQVVTLKPDDFLNGHNTCGRVLPHARVTVRDEHGRSLERNQIGQITIWADSLALGYYPYRFIDQKMFQTDDLGFFDDRNELHVIGRSSNKIITGGENVFPEEIEAVIRATGLVNDVCVIGMGDRHWGEVVTAVYVPHNDTISSDQIQCLIQDKLTRFKQPKHWLPVPIIDRNAQGKINRESLKQFCQANFSPNSSSH